MFGDALVTHPLIVETGLPPVESRAVGNAQTDSSNGARSGTVGRRGWPVEEGHFGTGVALAIGVKEMIGRNIVLIDGLFDQPHAEYLRIEGDVAGCVCGDSGDVVQSTELHMMLSSE